MTIHRIDYPKPREVKSAHKVQPPADYVIEEPKTDKRDWLYLAVVGLGIVTVTLLTTAACQTAIAYMEKAHG